MWHESFARRFPPSTNGFDNCVQLLSMPTTRELSAEVFRRRGMAPFWLEDNPDCEMPPQEDLPYKRDCFLPWAYAGMPEAADWLRANGAGHAGQQPIRSPDGLEVCRRPVCRGRDDGGDWRRHVAAEPRLTQTPTLIVQPPDIRLSPRTARVMREVNLMRTAPIRSRKSSLTADRSSCACGGIDQDADAHDCADSMWVIWLGA